VKWRIVPESQRWSIYAPKTILPMNGKTHCHSFRRRPAAGTAGRDARSAHYAGGTLEGGPHAGTPARLLYDFGKTNKEKAGWITLEHPKGGVPLPANTPIWLAWKGVGGKVYVNYQEPPGSNDDFQTTRGRWESKAIDSEENKAWPLTWPADDSGGFDDYWYSCYLTLQQANP
jgi:hypothetical protein